MLYIRVDANETIATGHVMRCLSIADAAKKLGKDTTFIMADDSAEQLVKSKGYKTIILHTPWNDMDKETGKLLEIIQKNGISRLLIDSYQVTENYLKALSEATKVTYIDDLDKFIYPVDSLICYAAYAEKFEYDKKYTNTKLYLGTKYAPLRQEFCSLGKKVIRDKIEKILILSGGTDKLNVLQSILDKLSAVNGIQIDAICGIYNPNFDILCARYKEFENIVLHRSTDKIIDYMRSADVAISAGGTTLYELCACGTPTISYIIADNQVDNATWFAEHDVIELAGDARKDDIGSNLSGILERYKDREYRKMLSEKMQEMVDGYGAERIAKLLIF